MLDLCLLILDDAFFSAIAAVGFAMVFNVPARLLFLCALGGALGHGSRTLLMHFGGTIVLSSFIAATLVGLVGVYWSRRYLVPRPVFTVASVIPMIPGTFAFKAMIGIFSLHQGGFSLEVLQSIFENGTTMLFILLALGFGLALPSVEIYRFKPIL